MDDAGAGETGAAGGGAGGRPGRSAVKSAERAMAVVRAVAQEPGRLTPPEISRRLGYPRSSLHALTHTLLTGGWLQQDPASGALSVGAELLVSGSAYLDGDPVVPVAQTTLEQIRSDTGHTAHYARLVGGSVLYLASRYARTEDAQVLRVGRSLPASLTALGQALLAERTDTEVDALLPATLPAETRHSITDPARLHAELELVRERGWALEREQSRRGRVCVAVVVGHRIPATDAISAVLSTEDAEAPEIERTVAVLLQTRDRLTTRLRREGVR